MDRGAWLAAVHMVAELDMIDYHFHFPSIYLSIYTHTHTTIVLALGTNSDSGIRLMKIQNQTYRTGYMERLPWWLSVNLPAMQETRVRSLGQ